MSIQEIEIFIISATTAQVTEKRKIIREIVEGEILEIWVNDRLEYTYKYEAPWEQEKSTDKEYTTKW